MGKVAGILRIDSVKPALFLRGKSGRDERYAVIETGKRVCFTLIDNSEIKGFFRSIESAWYDKEEVAVIETDEDLCRIGLSEIMAYAEEGKDE